MKIIIVMLSILLTACNYVPAGNVGIKVHLLGGDKGVDTQELSPGRYWIGMNEELYIFPTFTQNYIWTKDVQEGSPTDESFTFQTVEGLSANADIGISYSIQPDKVSLIFQKYRKGINEITHVYLRNMVRDALNKTTSTKTIESVYGAGKADIIKEVEEHIQAEVKPLGITIEHIYWIGEIRLPPQVTQAINNKINAVQIATQKENEVAQAKAEAEKAIAIARGEADSKLLVAEAEAKAIRLKGEAINQNPMVVQLNSIDKWNGVLPTMMSGPVPFVNVQK